MDPGYYAMGVPGEKMTTMEKGSPRTVMYKSVDINGISTRLKWCVTCEFYRPPRCSHCSICKHCIDTFDHHCPWLNNCIGRRNYRYFFSFLLSLTLHMIIVFGVSVTYVLMRTNQLSHYKVIIAIGVLILVGLLLLPVLGLTGFHIFLVSKGRTTNEQVTSKYDLDMNPYDQGLCKNWLYVFCTSQPPILNRSNVVKVDMWGISYNGKSIHHQTSNLLFSPNNSELPNICKPSDDAINGVQQKGAICEKMDIRNIVDHTSEHQNATELIPSVRHDSDSSVVPNSNSKGLSVNETSNAPIALTNQVVVSRSQSPVCGRNGEVKANSSFSSGGIKSKSVSNKDQGKSLPSETAATKHISNLNSASVDSVSAVPKVTNIQKELLSSRDHFPTVGDHSTPLLGSQGNPDNNLVRGRQLQKFTSNHQNRPSNSLQRKQREHCIATGIGRSSSRDFVPACSNEASCPHTSSTSMMNLRDRVVLPVNTYPVAVSQPRNVVAEQYGAAQDLKVAPSSPKSRSPLTLRGMHYGISGTHTSNLQPINHPRSSISKGMIKPAKSEQHRHGVMHQAHSRNPVAQGNQRHLLTHHSAATHQPFPQSLHGLPPPLPPHGSQSSVPHIRPMWSPVVPPHGLSVSTPYFLSCDAPGHFTSDASNSYLHLVRPPYFGNSDAGLVDASQFFTGNTRPHDPSVCKYIPQAFSPTYGPSAMTQTASLPTPPLPPHNRTAKNNASNNRMQPTGSKNSNNLIAKWQQDGESNSPDGTFEISV
ncbi:unnamed protein product [Heterobilharzia americana]|nr:unnamed protein product [Heterobilharzia americana]